MNHTDKKRMERALRSLQFEEAAALLGLAEDEISRVLGGAEDMSARSRAILVLWGSADKPTRESARRHLLIAPLEREWRAIPGFTKYQASSDGALRRFIVTDHAPMPRLLKLRVNKDGYLRATLYDDEGRMRKVGVHRAVALAFHGSAPGMYVCHRDGDKLNNAPSNVYWGTPAENAQDTSRHRERNGGYLGEPKTAAQVKQAILSGNISRVRGLQIMRGLKCVTQ